MIVTHTNAKARPKVSWFETEWKQIDGGDCISPHANAVGNNVYC